MSASVIRVGRRKRRSNCRPRPGCACGDVLPCVPVSSVASSVGEFFFIVTVSQSIAFLTFSTAGLSATNDGDPLTITGISLFAGDQMQVDVVEPLVVGPLTFSIPPGWISALAESSAHICPGTTVGAVTL